MFLKLSCRLKKALVWSVALVVLMSQPSFAGSIIDMDEVRPLGAVFSNAAGDQTYFSLGNGRALLIPVSQGDVKSGPVLQDLLLKDAGGAQRVQPARTGNLDKNLKW